MALVGRSVGRSVGLVRSVDRSVGQSVRPSVGQPFIPLPHAGPFLVRSRKGALRPYLVEGGVRQGQAFDLRCRPLLPSSSPPPHRIAVSRTRVRQPLAIVESMGKHNTSPARSRRVVEYGPGREPRCRRSKVTAPLRLRSEVLGSRGHPLRWRWWDEQELRRRRFWEPRVPSHYTRRPLRCGRSRGAPPARRPPRRQPPPRQRRPQHRQPRRPRRRRRPDADSDADPAPTAVPNPTPTPTPDAHAHAHGGRDHHHHHQAHLWLLPAHHRSRRPQHSALRLGHSAEAGRRRRGRGGGWTGSGSHCHTAAAPAAPAAPAAGEGGVHAC